MPGVPQPADVYPWPKTSFLQETQRISSNYVGYRRFLLQRYALRWLRALHDQDQGFYATTLFTHATDFAAEMDALEATDTVDQSEKANVDGMVWSHYRVSDRETHPTIDRSRRPNPQIHNEAMSDVRDLFDFRRGHATVA